MTAGALWILSLGVLPLSGMPLLLHKTFRSLPLLSRLAIGAGVGAFLVSLEMTALAAAGIHWNAPFLAAGAAVLAAGLRRLVPDEQPASAPKEASSRASIAGTLLSAAAVAVVVASVVGAAATSSDLLLFWGPKAEAFAAARTIDGSFLKEEFLGYLHPSYPPLVTNIYAFSTIVAGRFPWGAATAIFPLVLGGLAAALPGVLRLGWPRAWAAAGSALVVSAIGVLGKETNIAGNGEMPLLFFETLAMALLISPAATRPSLQILAGLLLGGAASTKVEGLPFVLAAVAFFALLGGSPGRSWSAVARLLLPTLVSVGLWLGFGLGRGLFLGYRGYGDFSTIYLRALPVVLTEIVRSLWSTGYALPFFFPLLFLLSARGRNTRWRFLPLGVAAVLSGFFVFTYLHEPDPTLWIAWSAARIFSVFIPLFVLAALAGLTADGRLEPPGDGSAQWPARQDSNLRPSA